MEVRVIRVELRCQSGANDPSRRACLLALVHVKDGVVTATVHMRDGVDTAEGFVWQDRVYDVAVVAEEYLALSCKHDQALAVRGVDVLDWMKQGRRVRFIG